MTRAHLTLAAALILSAFIWTPPAEAGGGDRTRVRQQPVRRSYKSGSHRMSSELKSLLQISRRSRRQYTNPRSRRGLTGVAQAKKITSALRRNGFKSSDVRSLRNFLNKAYVEHTSGSRFHSNWLREKSKSYAVTDAAARTFNAFFRKHSLNLNAAPNRNMSNPAVNRALYGNR